MWETILLYLTIVVLAAVPWVEILVVIPFGIGVGLNPVAVAVLAFIGNVIPVILIVIGFEQFNYWWARRRGAFLVNPGDESWDTGRRARAKQIMRKYGLPGTAALGPILIGVHFGTILALLMSAPRYQIIGWMAGSLIIWTIGITVASWAGISWLTSLF